MPKKTSVSCARSLAPSNSATRNACSICVIPTIEFHWPPSLPYGEVTYGRDQEGPSWGKTWFSPQPTEAERRMDPRVVATSDDEVVVLWHQRGRSPAGESCDGEVLALYKLRDGAYSDL